MACLLAIKKIAYHCAVFHIFFIFLKDIEGFIGGIMKAKEVLLSVSSY
jgi:hypothetical protein